MHVARGLIALEAPQATLRRSRIPWFAAVIVLGAGLGGISKAGNRDLRQMLVVGAMALIRYAQRLGSSSSWVAAQQRAVNGVAVGQFRETKAM